MQLSRWIFMRNTGLAALSVSLFPYSGEIHEMVPSVMNDIMPSPARQMEANLLLNCGPMTNGLLRPEDGSTLKSLRQ